MEHKTKKKAKRCNNSNKLYSTDILYCILSQLDTATLVSMKAVCKEWRDICNYAISVKAPSPRRAFESNEELKEAVRNYIDCDIAPDDAEGIASAYGWPIGAWDVSKVTDMSNV